jgi:antitoxin component YwqK of YwqJK toxin-antitoxin module
MDEMAFVYEDGKLVEEKTMKNGREIATLYYYYNDRNQMTDIVRFNDRAGRLLPDYMFEYGDNGQVIQKVTVPANSSDYLIWRYKYDARGIRSNEALFDKYRQLLARIDYTYSYW